MKREGFGGFVDDERRRANSKSRGRSNIRSNSEIRVVIVYHVCRVC